MMATQNALQHETPQARKGPISGSPEPTRPDSRAAAENDDGTRRVVVQRQWMASGDIKAVEIAAADGGTLPPAEAGAHIDVHMPECMVRQYSITALPAAPGHYVIGVLRDPQSRGGSAYMVDTLQTGDTLTITGPRNNFTLDESADHYQLIAGGIGITPLLAMTRRLQHLGKPCEFHYLVRNRERCAFLDELQALLPAHALHLHVDDEMGRPDLAALIAHAPDNSMLYTCGPEPLLAAVREATADWPDGCVQFERFHNTAANASHAETDNTGSCHVELRQSGIRFDLEAGETVLEALERHQLDPACLCREGICGTCAVGVIEGEIDHRDALQDDEDKARNDLMFVCVSRPVGPHLVLDL